VHAPLLFIIMLAVGRRSQAQSSSSIGRNPGNGINSLPSRNNVSRLSFYDTPPNIDVDIETFETYGISRLQVLRRIDVLQARGVKGDKFDKEINKADLEHLFNSNSSSSSGKHNGKNNNKDHISHYILRMAYCQNEELRRWFLTNECILFKIRFESAKSSDVDQFLRERKLLLKYPPITFDEKMELKPKLIGLHQKLLNNGGNNNNISSAATTGMITAATEHSYNNTEYYKVPFLDVLQLVSRRDVYIHGGYAYVSRTKILSIVEGKFRASLSKSLVQAMAMQSAWSSDSRIGPIVRKLSKVAFQYGGGGTALTSSRNNSGVLGNADGSLNTHAVCQIFVDYLKSVMGHSDPKMKPAGVNKMYVSVGTRKPNEADKRCPIAGRVHKSNTQKYTIYFDTLVMEQGCWDGCCQATNKHMYYQIRDDGRCAKVGWNPPVLDTKMISNILCGGQDSTTAAAAATTTTPAKKMKLSNNNSNNMKVTP